MLLKETLHIPMFFKIKIFAIIFSGFFSTSFGTEIYSQNESIKKNVIPVIFKSVRYNKLAEDFLYKETEKSHRYAFAALNHSYLPSDKARSMYNIAEAYFINNDFDNAIYWYKNALRLNKSLLDYSKTADCFANIGIIFEIKGDFDSALNNYNEAYLFYELIDKHKGMAMILNNIGILHTSQGNYEKGFEYFQKSLKIEERIGNKEGISYSLNNIGLVNRKMGRHDKAIEYYEKSLIIKEELEDYHGVAITSINIGKVYEENEDYYEANIKYNLALKNYKKINNLEGTATALNNIGTIYFLTEEYDKATELYQQSYELRMQIGNKSGIAGSLHNLGRCNMINKDYHIADKNLKHALEIALDLNNKELISGIYASYAELMNEIGNYQKAYSFLSLHKAQQDSLLNIENHRQIAELQTIYETEKKENKILLQQVLLEKSEAEIKREKQQKNAVLIIVGLLLVLSFFIYRLYVFKLKTNKILAKQNLQLNDLNTTRNKFFSLVSHDLRNPFGTLVSVSGMLNENFDKLDDEKKKIVINTINQSAVLTNELLENILTWATTQTGKISFNPEAFNLNYSIEKTLQLFINEAERKNILIGFERGEDIFIVADKNMIETVIRNLLSNAIKFTENGGFISIKTYIKSDYIYISVADNGIGLNENDLSKLFKVDTDYKKIGKSKNKGTGLGLILCKEFIELHHGKIFAESLPEGGTKFTFSLPLKKT